MGNSGVNDLTSMVEEAGLSLADFYESEGHISSGISSACSSGLKQQATKNLEMLRDLLLQDLI